MPSVLSHAGILGHLFRGRPVALLHPPKVGAVVLCFFPPDFSPPEMVKTRPVVAISPRIQGRHDLVGIVPLSTTEPQPMLAHHCEVPIQQMPRSLQHSATRVWAKCDMVYTFSLSRLDRFKAGRDRSSGKRLYEVGQLDLDSILNVRRCIAHAFGIPIDTP